MLEESLFGAVICGTSQTGQIDQHRDFLGGLDGLGRQVEVEVHFAVCGFGGVGKFEEFAAERGNGCFCCYGHFVWVYRGNWVG